MKILSAQNFKNDTNEDNDSSHLSEKKNGIFGLEKGDQIQSNTQNCQKSKKGRKPKNRDQVESEFIQNTIQVQNNIDLNCEGNDLLNNNQNILYSNSDIITENQILNSDSLTNLKIKNNKDENFKTGRWHPDEHQRFIEAILKYGNEWKKVQSHVVTRSSTQARSHAQKFFVKIKKTNLLDFNIDLTKNSIKSLHEVANQMNSDQYLNTIKTLNNIAFEKKNSGQLPKSRKKTEKSIFENNNTFSLKCDENIYEINESFLHEDGLKTFQNITTPYQIEHKIDAHDVSTPHNENEKLSTQKKPIQQKPTNIKILSMKNELDANSFNNSFYNINNIDDKTMNNKNIIINNNINNYNICFNNNNPNSGTNLLNIKRNRNFNDSFLNPNQHLLESKLHSDDDFQNIFYDSIHVKNNFPNPNIELIENENFDSFFNFNTNNVELNANDFNFNNNIQKNNNQHRKRSDSFNILNNFSFHLDESGNFK